MKRLGNLWPQIINFWRLNSFVIVLKCN